MPDAFLGLNRSLYACIAGEGFDLHLNRSDFPDTECLDSAVMHRSQVPDAFGVDQPVRLDDSIGFDLSVLEQFDIQHTILDDSFFQLTKYACVGGQVLVVMTTYQPWCLKLLAQQLFQELSA